MANTSFLKWAAVQAAGPELARRLVSAMRVERTFPDVKTETIASPAAAETQAGHQPVLTALGMGSSGFHNVGPEYRIQLLASSSKWCIS